MGNNLKRRLSEWWPFLALILLAKGWLFNLPYFWDELQAGYGVLVINKYPLWDIIKSTILEPRLYYDHPPLYTLTFGLLSKIFGNTPLVMHSLQAFSFSFGLYFFWKILLHYSGDKTRAWLGTLVWFSLPLIFTQSTMLYRDMIVSILFLVTFYGVIKERWRWVAIACLLSLLTKITAMAYVVPISLYMFFKLPRKQWVKLNLLAYSGFILFLVRNLIVKGTLFTNQAAQDAIFSADMIVEKVGWIFQYVFLYEARLVFVLFVFDCVFFIKNVKWKKELWIPAGLIILSLIAYSFHLGKNTYYYSPVVTAMVLMSSILFIQWMEKKIYYFGVLAFFIGIGFFYHSTNYFYPNENSLKYTDGVKIQQDLIKTLEEHQAKHLIVVWPFSVTFTNKSYGYINRKMDFVAPMYSYDRISQKKALERLGEYKDKRFLYIDSNLNDQDKNKYLKDHFNLHGLFPLKHLKQGDFWVKIYQFKAH
jgi:hypothetical protein